MEDQELEFELQELYLTGKQWLSDIDFLDDELTFLMALVEKFPLRTKNVAAYKEESAAFGRKAVEHTLLKAKVMDFMARLEPLILSRNPSLKLLLIEEYYRLNKEITDSLEALKRLKYACVKIKQVIHNHSTLN